MKKNIFPSQWHALQRRWPMTQGECLFYLREIQKHWCTSNVSPDKLAILAEAKLIELRPGAVPAVRLTHDGERCKIAGRSHHETELRLRGRAKSRQRPQRRSATKPRPLV
jgi:hypothetical protein